MNARGETTKFVLDVAATRGVPECIEWPFFQKEKRRYGRMTYQGKTWAPHRLVCTMVNGPEPYPGAHAAHKCGVSTCINPDHLRWATPHQNAQDKYKHGTVQFGTNNPRSKLKEEDVRRVRELLASHNCNQIAKMFGVNSGAIHNIKTGHTWGWLS